MMNSFIDLFENVKIDDALSFWSQCHHQMSETLFLFNIIGLFGFLVLMAG